MRIGIDSRPLCENQTSGIPMYVRSLVEALSQADQKNEYILYSHKPFKAPPIGPNFRECSGSLSRYGSLWMQVELPFWLTRDHVDIFWGTQHILPLSMSPKIKGVLTVHDLVYCVYPETMKRLNLLINKFIIPPSIRRADAIVSISNWTMHDVKRVFNPKEKLLRVIHQGVATPISRRDPEAAKKKVAERFGFTTPFILAVGTFEPRKNIAGLFRAFSMLADKIPHTVAIVGRQGWKNEGLLAEIEKSPIRDRFRIIGYVEGDFLPEVYSAADVFVFPSLYEGFGFPPLEAMACGVPVVASNVSSIPEVVEKAAVLVDPMSPQSIADGIYKVVTDNTFRQQLVFQGLAQAAKFTWSRTAFEMLRVFNEV